MVKRRVGAKFLLLGSLLEQYCCAVSVPADD